jgi:hypothetical protein
MPLFAQYQFSASRAVSVRAKVSAITSGAGKAVLAFPGGLKLPNVYQFYEDFLSTPTVPGSDYHYVSYVHGDLNAANVLVDGHDNVWSSISFTLAWDTS